MKVLGSYTNGNYKVVIFDDGTKIRVNDLDYLESEFPESIDLCITKYCEQGCKFCYNCSSKEGKHADLSDLSFLDNAVPYQEVAIGGGDAMSHPQLIPFLKELKDRKLIANLTVHQNSFMKNVDLLRELCKEGLVHGLGVSLYEPTDNFIREVREFPNAVLHVVNGVVKVEDLTYLSGLGLKILILGYKDIGRGERYKQQYLIQHEFRKNKLYNSLEDIFRSQWFQVVSFDNLALEQLEPKRFLTDKQWKQMYMGDDGEYTFYIDLVDRTYAQNSLSDIHYDMENKTVKEMFTHIKNEK
jgi:hypothetical protein